MAQELKKPELEPLMQEYVKDSDTAEIIIKAIEIAAEHPFYKIDGATDRFTTFLTEKEAYHNGILKAGRVDEKSWKAVYRFGRAIEKSRKLLKK